MLGLVLAVGAGEESCPRAKSRSDCERPTSLDLGGFPVGVRQLRTQTGKHLSPTSSRQPTRP
jgi:hypothetical protein